MGTDGSLDVDALVRKLSRRHAQATELIAREAIARSLRPRLQWAARRPRALKLLKRLRLWTPPVFQRAPFGTCVYVTAGRVMYVEVLGVRRG